MLSRSAPAKINLGLHVLRKRDDGYHDVETVLHRIDWADAVSVEGADAITMTCSDPDLPVDERNLCVQAALRLRDAFDVDHGAAIHLDKTVPYGAGLGGGSSDAATTLQLLNELWALDASDDVLHDVAAQIGSDVPFFLLDAPAALATGRGEVLSPLRRDDGTPFRLPFALVVAVPPVAVSTPEAYGLVTPHDDSRPDLRDVVTSADLRRWRAELVNDFQRPVAAAYPQVDTAIDVLREHGGDYVTLSGSGSAVVGVFRPDAQAHAAATRVRAEGYRVFTSSPTDA